MKRGPIIHGVLLVAALLFAYQTWTREDKIERNIGDIQVWSVPEDAVTAVVYDTEKKTIRLEKRTEGGDSYLWGSQTRVTRKPKKTDDGSREYEEIDKINEFMAGEKGQTLFNDLANLRALRDLGSPSDEDLKEYGLVDSKDNVTLTYSGGTKSLVIGGRIYGGRDRYVRDPETGKAYVVAGAVIDDLLTGESALRLRKVHAFEYDEVDKAVVSAAGQTRSLVRITVEDEQHVTVKNWADASKPGEPDQTMSNFLQNIDRLRPTRFEPELDVKELTLMVKVDYQRSDGGAMGWLELYEQVIQPEPAEKPEEDASAADQASDGQGGEGEATGDQDPGEETAEGDDTGAADEAEKEDNEAEKEKEEEAKKPIQPKRRVYYIRTELTRVPAVVPLDSATRITEDIDQLFGE